MKENKQEQLIKAAEKLFKTYKYQTWGTFNRSITGDLWYDYVNMVNSKDPVWIGSKDYLQKLKLI